MKIKRYAAPDMRSAMKMIREEQGHEAVILSSRQTGDGVEVCAAADMEALLAAEAAASAPPLTAAASQSDFDPVLLRPGSEPAQLGHELRSIRRLLEQELAVLAWNDYTRREPQRAQAMSELAALGVASDIASSIVQSLPANISAEQAQQWHYGLLARRIVAAASPLERAGHLALAGPPGGGKTTTLCKLAARWVREQGGANMAIISVDDERIGAGEQLRTMGRVLGVSTYVATGARECAARLAALADRQLVLVDTSGAHSPDAGGVLSALRECCPSLRFLWVLPASAQAGVLDASAAHAMTMKAEAAVLTRIDEADSLGGALSALARTSLPLAFSCHGPRIPEDLKPARAHQLVARAVELARSTQSSADEACMARRYAGGQHAAT